MNSRDAEFLRMLIESAQEPEYEMHADGVKEKKPCPSCEPIPCGNDWCPMEDEE